MNTESSKIFRITQNAYYLVIHVAQVEKNINGFNWISSLLLGYYKTTQTSFTQEFERKQTAEAHSFSGI